jgi:chemotaxis protein MotB
MKDANPYSEIGQQDTEINFWPGFIDVFVSILMIFILIAFIRLILNSETLEMLEIKASQEQFQHIFNQEFESEIKEGKIKIISRGNFQQITFSSEILFDSGSAVLSYHGKVLLRRLLFIFETARQKSRFKQIQVEGHTDNVPISDRLKEIYASNWELSSQRAINVVQYFTSFIDAGTAKLLAPSLFSGTGYAYHKPVATNNTTAGKALNRRIEIRLVYFSEFGKKRVSGE